jgi:hypothetical protein
VFDPAAYCVAYDINTVTDATLTTSGSIDSSSANDPIDQSDLDDPGAIPSPLLLLRLGPALISKRMT